MKKILANLPIRQRIIIAVVLLAAAGSIFLLVRHQHESDFKPLFTGVAPEDAAVMVQKLKEAGVDYRLSTEGGVILAPSAKLAELRINMAAAGLPKTGRIGFEIFDKTNLGATEFTEHINYQRAIEGELERSVMSLAEVEQARVHVTFAKDSVFLESQQPAKASVLVKLRPGSRLAPQNVVAIDNLIAAAVEGLSPDAVSVLDMNGNLLGRPKPPGSLDGPEPSEAALDYRHHLEADLLSKVNSTLEPLVGPDKFRANVSLDCDFSGGEVSEEIFDPEHSVMSTSQRTEDASGSAVSSGVPGTASNLPRPAPRPAAGNNRVSRTTENIAYQTSRTVKKMRLPAGVVKKMSLAVLVDQSITWEKSGNTVKKVLVPPSPETMKIIHDVVAGATGFNADRGDQLVIETLPFESTLQIELPLAPGANAPAPKPTGMVGLPFPMNRKTILIGAGGLAAAIVLIVVLVILLRKRGKKKAAAVAMAAELAAADTPAARAAISAAHAQNDLEAQLAERDALQQKSDAQVLTSLKLAPVITKKAEVLAKHLRERISKEPEVSAQILRTWIREEEQ
ncbi:MAG TPA: flagellar basal-body MS-ring/collar protein FliF [Bryobacteraceae bacterium]|jgi:flagellar M-ring protein FliF|nr:flagellar basal-body MS-ring/collar protein FliF [Bryobacteraceae bacterium]